MLTDAQVAALCDIAQSVALAGDRRREIERLVQEGYVAGDDGRYRLTPKAEKALSDRGVGLNEA
jgi:DNA-binding IclR family transcriptional regulator